MKNLILIPLLMFSVSIFSQDIEKISSKANEHFGMKQYQQSIEQCKIGLAISGEDKGTLLYKSFICEILYRIYKTENFEGYNLNLSYNYLKQAAEIDIQYKKLCGTYDSEKTKLEQKLEQLLVDFPGCDKEKNEIASTNKITNSANTDKTVSINVSGSGKTQDEAKQSALRSAIEQAFGAFISAKTEILNDQVISDQIASVASGNIQSFDILNASQLPDGTWGVTLKALVSIDKLTSFVESKGIVSEFKGSLFAINIKQQILNEEAEFNAICNMISLLHEPMQTAFDYSINTGEPKSMDAENKNWEIPLSVTVTANNNMKICSDYILNTLKSISLTDNELENYKKLNKQIFPIRLYRSGERINLYLRKGSSIIALNSFTSLYDFYVRCFKVQSIETNIKTESVCSEKKSKFKIGPICDCAFNSSTEFNTFLIPLFQSNEKITSFSWNDNKSLSQIEKIQKYTVEPTGVQSRFKNGGFVVTEENGHGFVLSLFDIDLKASSYWSNDELYFKFIGFIDNEMANTILNGYSFNGYNDWRIPTVLEMKNVQDKLIKNGFLFSKTDISGVFESNDNDYFCFDKDEYKITKFLLMGKREWSPNKAHFRPVRSF